MVRALTGVLLEHERGSFFLRAHARREQRDTRLRSLGFASYEAYLGSSRWREKRSEFWTDPDTLKDCGVCGTTDATLALHHRTYERVGEERLSDLYRRIQALSQSSTN